MSKLSALENYLTDLCEHLGHVNRHQNFCDYLKGLLLVEGRKSVEPMAAALDPVNTRSKHQALHLLVADLPWSDQRILDKVWQWMEAHIAAKEQRYLIVDDTGIPKKGTHSVGVSHQYCGQPGKQANCQVAVSVSLACEKASVPVAWQLYLPKSWSEDRDRCDVVGVPEYIGFSTKSQIALSQLQQCHERGIPLGVVLADAAYGNDHSFREGLDALGLSYVVGTKSNTSVWGTGVHPLKPTLTKDQGRLLIHINGFQIPGTTLNVVLKNPLVPHPCVWAAE